MALISVIIPTRNRNALLQRALASVKSQTVRDLDVWVVNDGGLAPTLCDSIRVVTKTQGGPGSARNAGIAASDSRFIAYLDDDDEWRPTHLESMLTALDSSHSMAYAAADVMDAGRHVRVWGDCAFVKFIADGFFTIFPPSACMHSRDLLDRCGLFDESPLLIGPEDCEFIIRASDFCAPVPTRERSVVMHRDDSMTRDPRAEWVDTLAYVIAKNGYTERRHNWLMLYRAYTAAVREARPEEVRIWGADLDLALPKGATRRGEEITGDIRITPEGINAFCRERLSLT